MKKMLSLAIALALCFSLCACVGNAPQGKSALDWDAMQEELQASSEVLTAQLTNFAFYSGDILGSSAYPLEDRQIHLFILSTVMFMEEEKYLYHDFVTMDDEGCYHFPKEKIQQMAEEVFDIRIMSLVKIPMFPKPGSMCFGPALDGGILRSAGTRRFKLIGKNPR